MQLTGDWVRANYRFHDVIYEAAAGPVRRGGREGRAAYVPQPLARGRAGDRRPLRQNTREHRAILGAIEASSA